MEMRDYAEIERHIAQARRLRSEAMGEYLAAAGRALARGATAALSLLTRKPQSKSPRNPGPYLPA
jgi:hypothetical protein